jgi:hypothetical protein
MPSSDRSEPRVTEPAPETRGQSALPQSRPIKPAAADGDAQYFDPGEPWDAQAAEALTSLYEDAHDEIWRRREQDYAQRRAPPEAVVHSTPSEPLADWTAAVEARFTGLIQTVQDSLASLKPDHALDPIHRRIDALEERLGEALEAVARRSDVEGLRLIEAQVTELARHIEQAADTKSRVDGLDSRVRELSRKFEEDGLQRLDALERTLQSYIAEWRHSEERSTGAIEALDETLSRISASMEAAEDLRPAPSLAMSELAEEADSSALYRDPLAQVYAEGARALTPHYQINLDASDYTPGAPVTAAAPVVKLDPLADLLTDTAAKKSEPPATKRVEPPAPADVAPMGSELAPPAFRASAIRARLQQIQILEAESELGKAPSQPEKPPVKEKSKVSSDYGRARPSVLLAAGITLFAAAGYLLVDVFFTPHPAPTQGAAPAQTRSDKRANDAPATWTKQTGRLDALGTAIASAFRDPSETPSRIVHSDAPAPVAEPLTSELVMAPALSIGPASLRQAAMNGDAIAQYEVGLRYAAGRGVPQDLAASFQWHARAAARGLAAAQFRVAAMYERGQGTASDIGKARNWYLRAAQQGHVKAMHNLAVLSIAGGRNDYPLAVKWFTEAAERGLADSQFNLAVLHQNGLGVPKNLKEAYKWLALAARSGDGDAASRIATIKSQLSPAEVRATDAVVAAWRVRAPDPGSGEPPTGFSERP